MSKVALFALALVACATVQLVDAQVFSYKVTVYLGTNSAFDKTIDGKLKIQFRRGDTKHLIALSPETEKLSRGSVKEYIVAAPINIGELDKVTMEWSYRREVSSPSGWFKSPKIYIDRVTIEPTYIQDVNMRAQSMKAFCPTKRPESLKAKEEVDFWVRC